MRRLSIRYLLISGILTSALLLSSSCTLLPDTNILPPPTDNSNPIEPDWTSPGVESDALVLPNIADVVAKVRPSVVAINTEVVTYDIFNRPFTQEGAGSGWIIDETGIIVTNNHVVEGAEKITVTLSDNRVFEAEMVKTDSLTDLAILKIATGKLPEAKIGDSSDLRVGEWVVAIGNPLGLGISAKEGIISRLKVPVSVSEGQTIYDLIETSAAINPGNSGGPLVNMAGQVIGITSLKIATVGVEGMGYALNINDAVPIIEQLITIGYVVRPWLGVVFFTVDQFTAFRYRLSVDQGALVTEVAAGSPADKAGIRQGDVIVGFDDKEITSADDLIQAIHDSQIGQTVEITFWRGDAKKTISTTLAETPPS